MYIQFIHIYGFGKYHDFSLELQSGFNLIEGENEAGKSTLISFIKAIFFGFESRRFPEERYEPLKGGRFGGRIALRDEQGSQYVVERIGHKTSQGTVRVTLPNGTEHGEEMLKALLFGMTPNFYVNIYAFGLTELSYLTSLAQDEVASYLYHAGTSVSLPKVKKAWQEEGERLFRLRGTQPVINQQLSRLEEIDQQIRELRRENESYNEWIALRDQLDRDIEQLEKNTNEFLEKQRKWEKAKEAFGLCKERKASLERLLELPSLSSFPENGDRRLAEYDQQILTLSVEIEDEQWRMEEIEQALAAIRIRPEIDRMKDEIEWLIREGEKWRDKKESLSTLKARIQFMRRELLQNIEKLGLDWTEERLRHFNVPMRQKEAIRSWRQQFDQLRAGWQAVRENMRLKRAELEDARNQLYETQAGMGDLTSERQLVETVEKLSACRQLLFEMESDQRQKEWFESRLRAVPVRDTRSRVVRLTIVFAAIGAAASAMLFSYSGFNWPPFIPLLVMAFAFGLLRMSEADKKRSREEWLIANQHLQQLQKNIEEKRRRLLELTAGFGGTPDLSRIDLLLTQANEQRAIAMKQSEKLAWLEEKNRRLEKEWMAMNERKEALARRQKELKEQWHSQLTEYFLPDDLSPDGALELLALIEKEKGTLSAIELEREKLEQLEEEWNFFQKRLRAMYDQLFPKEPLEDPFLMVAEAKKLLREQAKQSERKLSLEEEKRQSIAAIQKKERLLEKIKQEREDLLAQVSVEDSESFYKLHRQYMERVELLEKIRMIEFTLDTADVDEQIMDIVDAHSLSVIQQRIEYWSDQWALAQQQLKMLIDQRGQYTDRIRQLESNDRLSLLNQQRQELLATVEEEAKKWVALRIANQLLLQTQSSYESRKQPTVLREASTYFAQMTSGRYQRVLSPIGEERLLVERQDGERLEPKFLSRGAREQLFLSLRLGLIKETGKRGALPIILDDILVNFDDHREQAAIHCIRQFASNHQILYFTCSSRSVESMKDLAIRYHRARLTP